MVDAPRTVLIADGDAGIRSLVKLTLDGDSYDVVEAADGESALVQVARHRPDLVLVDASLPGASGAAVCRSLKAQPETREARVVLLHSRDAPADGDGTETVGADGYLAKPFTSFALLRKVEALVGSGTTGKG